jgi:hypothetical protein
MNRTVVGRAACVLALLSFVNRPNAATVGALTGVDYYEIQTLYGRSLHDLSLGADNGQSFARIFAPDAEVFAPAAHLTGRSAIALQSLSSRGARFWLSNLLVEPTSSGAIGWAYIVQSRGEAFVEGGLYHDVLVRMKEGWRIRTRTYLPGTQWTRKDLPDMPKTARMGDRLTAADYEDIKNLVYRYNVGYDNAGPFDQGLLSIQPFTPDAVFERLNGPTYVGEQIAGQSTRHKPLLHHWDSNFFVTLLPSGDAQSFNYDMQFNVDGTSAPIIGGAGVLIHRYRKTPVGWRIVFRRYQAVGAPIEWPAADAVPFASRLASDGRPNGSSLASVDYAQIDSLYMQNNLAYDSAAEGGQRFADTFTSDGILVRGAERVIGSQALAAIAHANRPGLHTWISNITIQPTKFGANGRAYVLSALISGEPGVKQSALNGFATFDDMLVRTPTGWRFKQRTVTPIQ